MQKLLSTTSNHGRAVVTVAKVLGVSGADANPHLWYDLPRVSTVAQSITNAFVAADPADRTTFEQNLATFNASMNPLLDAVATIRRQNAGAPVAYTERVPGYLLADAGLTVKTPPGFAQAIEDGNEPSARDNSAMESLITAHQIRVLLYNAQATSPITEHMRTLARQNNIPVIGVTETVPPSEQHYQQWQLDQLRQLMGALGD
jgi:zinc/manganese transport system substrate-binding protein